jgi:hypothetical protein
LNHGKSSSSNKQDKPKTQEVVQQIFLMEAPRVKFMWEWEESFSTVRLKCTVKFKIHMW